MSKTYKGKALESAKHIFSKGKKALGDMKTRNKPELDATKEHEKRHGTFEERIKKNYQGIKNF